MRNLVYSTSGLGWSDIRGTSHHRKNQVARKQKRNENSNICNWMKTKAKIISIGLSHVCRISMAQNNSLHEETDMKPVYIL